MCYDAKTSINVFLFSFVISLFLFWRNYPLDRFIAFIFFFIMIMQIIEYFMWIDQDCKKSNRSILEIEFNHNGYWKVAWD